jgi:hypothetical protein
MATFEVRGVKPFQRGKYKAVVAYFEVLSQ